MTPTKGRRNLRRVKQKARARAWFSNPSALQQEERESKKDKSEQAKKRPRCNCDSLRPQQKCSLFLFDISYNSVSHIKAVSQVEGQYITNL